MTEEPNSDPTDDARTRSFSAAEAESGGLIAGRYKLLEQIGEGGMGDVWLAQQEHPVRRRVALKLIKSGLDNKSVIARFEAERQALAMMDHQNIAKVLDAGTSNDGRPFFVMEFAPGVSFTKYCDQNKLSIGQRLELFVPVCSAIQHAHQKGIIHRDLKPSNVLVCLVDGKPVPKVIDFGLAKALQHTTHLTDKTLYTEFGQVVGTLQYMSPEQAEMSQLDIDTRTDIYSLGVMLYELLTGSTPIDADTAKKEAILKVLETIREKDPPRPSARLTSSTHEAVARISQHRRIDASKLKNILRGELDWIVMKALEKDRTRRYATANGFAEDIENYLRGDVVSARPPSTSYRVRKYVSKHKGFVASILSIATVLIAGIISTGWFAIDANIARTKANQKTTEVTAEKKKVELERDRANAEKEQKEEALERTEATLARSNYFLANVRWNENRVAEAIDLLQRIPVKFRGFEWYLDRRIYQGSDITLYGHRGAVTSVAFSPDGTRLVSGSDDETIRFWDARTGEEVRMLNANRGTTTSVAFSPDGKRLASGSSRENITLWEVAVDEDIREVRKVPLHFGGRNWAFPPMTEVASVAFSPDSTWFASGSKWHLKLLDGRTGEEIRTFGGPGEPGAVSSVAFSPDGTELASTSSDKSIKLWNVRTGEFIREFSEHQRQAISIAYSPNGTRLASAFDDNTITLWNPKTGEKVDTLTGQRGILTSVAFSPDGTRLASGSADNTIKIWNVGNGGEVGKLVGHQDKVTSIAFSPDGTRLVSGSYDKTIKLWDVTTFDNMRKLVGHQGIIRNISVSPDGKRLASISDDETIRLWDLQTGEEMRRLNSSNWYSLNSDFSPDGKLLAISSSENVKFLDARSGTDVPIEVSKMSSAEITVFSPDGSFLAVQHGATTIWDVKSGEPIQNFHTNQGPISQAVFSPDGLRLLIGWDEGTITLFNVLTGDEIWTTPVDSGNVANVLAVALSPDGTRLAIGSITSTVTGTIELRDALTGKQFGTVENRERPIPSLDFSEDGTRLVFPDGTVRVWDVQTGEEIRTLNEHQKTAMFTVFGPHDSFLASGSANGAITLWDAPLEVESFAFIGRQGRVTSAALSSDGARLASGSEDSAIKIWDATTGAEIRTLVGHKGSVDSVVFSNDSSQLKSKDSSGLTMVWEVHSGDLLEDAEWQGSKSEPQRSADGRWFVVPSGNNVLLVDLEFKNLPHEKAYRDFKSRLDPHWHRKHASSAVAAEDWYSAMFHWAWVMKADPEQAPAYDSLHVAYDQWCVNFKPPTGESGNGNVQESASPLADQSVIETSSDVSSDSELFLPPIVREMLKSPRGTKE